MLAIPQSGRAWTTSYVGSSVEDGWTDHTVFLVQECDLLCHCAARYCQALQPESLIKMPALTRAECR